MGAGLNVGVPLPRIKNTIENSAAYAQSRLKELKNENRMAVIAASQAQRAADYISG